MPQKIPDLDRLTRLLKATLSCLGAMIFRFNVNAWWQDHQGQNRARQKHGKTQRGSGFFCGFSMVFSG